MITDQELDEGLAAFDRLGQEMARTSTLIQEVRTDLKKRHEHERSLSRQLSQSMEDTIRASQKAVQAVQTKVRYNLAWMGLTALTAVLLASGGGYYLGHQSGREQGWAEAYQTTRNEQAAASWANTPSGQRAYALDQLGSLDLLTMCLGNGWTKESRKGRMVCFPNVNAKGELNGWFIP